MNRRDFNFPTDIEPLLRFVQRVFTRDSRWHVGDLGWEFGYSPDLEPGWHMALWERGGQIVGWAWLARTHLCVLIDPRAGLRGEPGAELTGEPCFFLMGEMLDWAFAVAGAAVEVTVATTQDQDIRALVRRGYTLAPSDQFFLNMQRSLADLPPIPALPEGFMIRSIGADDVAARAELHRLVWSSAGPTEAAYEAMTRRWPYRADLDRVVVTPDGQMVAYLHGWYDEQARVGEFEPVGTLEEFRGRGLSRALGYSVLHAFHDLGGEYALVYARGDDGYPVPRQVYSALGFREYSRIVRYLPAA